MHSLLPEAVRRAAAHPPPERAHDRQFADLYADLRRIARRESHRCGEPLGATTLLHEAYLKIAERQAAFDDRAHFVAYAARTMRCLVVDHLRAQAAAKRGGDVAITSLDTKHDIAEGDGLPSIQDVAGALDDLAALDPDLAHVVDLKFFCGFTAAEISGQLGISERAVGRLWEKARALLYASLRAG
jgi:RNA polymerase sigma factor (TIGR02999 family)